MLACPAAISLTTYGRKSNMRPKIVKQQGGLVASNKLLCTNHAPSFVYSLLSVTDPAEAVYSFFPQEQAKVRLYHFNR
jgi:hypothetical protein